MTLQPPRRAIPNGSITGPTNPDFSLQTPNFSINTNNVFDSSPNTPILITPAATAQARNASLNALLGIGTSTSDLSLGDLVDVPGGMVGTIRFLGPVAGKKGVFAGVELQGKHAVMGKNNGDVNGTTYFTPDVSGSGIFVPAHRASKRPPPIRSSSSAIQNGTPPPPPSRPQLPPPSPSSSFGLARPSLSKQSPSRKVQHPSPVPGASLSRPGTRNGLSPGSSMPRPSLSPIPRPPMPRPSDARDQLLPPTTPSSARPGSRLRGPVLETHSGLGTPSSQKEIIELRRQLEEKNRQVEEQTATLADMEVSLSELQALIPAVAAAAERGQDMDETGDLAQLRALIREKNERISMLTAEFDAHRADFRSTIDTLEMASNETERVYERRVEELLQEIDSLRLAGAESNHEEALEVTEQLRQLEALVVEFEQGMEEARRGEAEARNDLDFLRGEVEKAKSELRRERENGTSSSKAKTSDQNGPSIAELDARDDEIRGLKAIIHSLSAGGDLDAISSSAPGGTNRSDPVEAERLGHQISSLERETADLQALVRRKSRREEELERELEGFKARESVGPPDKLRHGAHDSQATIVPDEGIRTSFPNSVPPSRLSIQSDAPTVSSTVSSTPVTDQNFSASITEFKSVSPINRSTQPRRRSEPSMSPKSASAVTAQWGPPTPSSEVPWCDICDKAGHDILDCTAVDELATSPSLTLPASLTIGGGRLPPGTLLTRWGSTGSYGPVASPGLSGLAPPALFSSASTSRSGSRSVSAAVPSVQHYSPSNQSQSPDRMSTDSELLQLPNSRCVLCDQDGHDMANCSNIGPTTS